MNRYLIPPKVLYAEKNKQPTPKIYSGADNVSISKKLLQYILLMSTILTFLTISQLMSPLFF